MAYLGSTGSDTDNTPFPVPIPANLATSPAQGPAQLTTTANWDW